MQIILFEDELIAQLEPVTLARPGFMVSCGSYRLWDVAARLGTIAKALVRPHLRAVLSADHPELADLASPLPTNSKTLWINARVVPSVESLNALERLAKAERSTVVRTGKSVAAALLDGDQAPPDWSASPQTLSRWLEGTLGESSDEEISLLEYPHDLVRYQLSTLTSNLNDRIRRGEYDEAADGVFLASGAKLGQYCVCDTRHGPIVIERGATVGPFCYLNGPIHIGANTKIIEHASIKDAVSIGHTAKIGGEVEATIVEPYTNKQHHGFLGHSYLGSWINFGAGTCNSDLKNTYGMVNVEYAGRKTNTGMQFVGCFVGDYSKTAINTSIFTGKTIGVCSMLYGFVTTNVPSFANYARSFGHSTEASAESAEVTQGRMFGRRKLEQRPCDAQLIRDLFKLTAGERNLPDEPLRL